MQALTRSVDRNLSGRGGFRLYFSACDANIAAQVGSSTAVQPVSKTWHYKDPARKGTMHVSRTQVPLLPRKQCTLHSVQGKTADPGFIAHWTWPAGLAKESIWLAYYVSLSRPRSFSKLLSHGLPDRDIIEGGPPERIADAFQEMFGEKISKTKLACTDARVQMGWPCRVK